MANMTENNDIWIFLSHSNKDYEKVRQVRNLLEEHSLRPIMFFLKCLNDNDEIDSLIKREIDCRTRFILCDSENARNSYWVQKEMEYIKSQNRHLVTIDLSKNIEEIYSTLNHFINQTRIFISYNGNEFKLADMVYNRLSKLDFSVYIDRLWDFSQPYKQKYCDTIHHLTDSVIRTNGYVVAIMNKKILTPTSSSRYELKKAIHENISTCSKTPNIIPFTTDASVISAISEDAEINILTECNIKNLEQFCSIEDKCNEIVKTVITKLMSSGSIKVLADNFAQDGNAKEAEFLYRIIDSEIL